MADYLLDTNVISDWYDDTPTQGGGPKPAHKAVRTNVERVRIPNPETGYVPRFYVSFVTHGEIEYGARTSRTPDPAKGAAYSAMDAAKKRFVSEQCPEELKWNKHVPIAYGELKAWVFEYCAPKELRPKKVRFKQLIDPATATALDIADNDLWIAAQAMTHDLVLVTRDRRGNFGKVLQQFASSLRVEDWAT